MGEQQIINSLIQDYMDTILDNFDEGIYITDNEANTVYLNHSYELVSGLQKSDMIGKNMRDLVESGVVSMSGSLSVLERKTSITIEQSFKTGKRALITSIPIFDKRTDSDHIIMVVTVVRETTELHAIHRELERQEGLSRQYRLQLEDLRRELEGEAQIIAADSKTSEIVRTASRIAVTDSPVLITGEDGSGKNRLAEYIHSHSSRSESQFMRIDFSSISGTDIDSYLFGGMSFRNGQYQAGILESVIGGTLYIDEIADVPRGMYVRLGALLHNESIVLGDGNVMRMDIRILAGSKYSLQELKKNFPSEEEILDEISLFTLNVQPLRERRDDIVPLAECFLKQYNIKSGENKRISGDGYKKLMEYGWPGNVMELKNMVQRAAIICEDDVIDTGDLGLTDDPHAGEEIRLKTGKIDLKEETARFEAAYMGRAFDRYGNVRDAAESLGIDSSTFVRKRQKYKQNGWMD